MKILVAVPCMDTWPVNFGVSLIEMLSYSQAMSFVSHDEIRLCPVANSLVYDARNTLSLTAIEQNFDYVLWLDSDMVFHADTLERMLKTIKTSSFAIGDWQSYAEGAGKYQMLTGVYYMRKPPHTPVLYKTIAEPELTDGQVQKKIETMTDIPDTLFEVEGCGFGCVLTSVPLLKKVWDKFGPAFTPYPWASEDMSFCYRVKQLGEKILCDPTIYLGHIGTMVFDSTNVKIKKGE